MLSNLNQGKLDDYIDDLSFIIMGAPQAGKTSLCNALLGYNEDKNDD